MGNKIQVETDHYSNFDYESKGRFASYWHQINETVELKPKSILEIGVGSRFYRTYLIHLLKFKLISLDFDKKLYPDVAGDLLHLPFNNNAFDCIVCFQVLEHIPYDLIGNALIEFFRVTSKYVVFSIPDQKKSIGLNVYFKGLPIRGTTKIINLPFLKENHIYDGQHYWELNKKGYLEKEFRKLIIEQGFAIIKDYRVYEKCTHHFFIIKKND